MRSAGGRSRFNRSRGPWQCPAPPPNVTRSTRASHQRRFAWNSLNSVARLLRSFNCVRHPRRHRHFLRSGVTSRRRKMRPVISCAANNIQILFISKYNRTEWKKARRRSFARFGNSWVEKFCAYSDSEKCPPFYFMASCTFSKVYGLWAHVHGVWVSTFWAMRF